MGEVERLAIKMHIQNVKIHSKGEKKHGERKMIDQPGERVLGKVYQLRKGKVKGILSMKTNRRVENKKQNIKA